MHVDPTDEAVAAMTRSFTAKVKECPMPRSQPWDPPGAAAFFGCPTEDAMRVVLDAIPTDVLARVVAGRPDQPTQTTTVGMPVLIDGTPSDVGEWCDREYHAAPGAYCSRRVLLLDISAHTDPHTPNQGDTP